MTIPVFNIVDYGAVGDGETLNTTAIQAAFAACAAAGGGTVVVPAGRFVSGALNMPSNLTLHLSAGATLLGSTNRDDYPVEDFEWSVESNRAGLLSARDAENVTIEGRGVIDGRGLAFVMTDRLKEFEPFYTDYDPAYTRQRQLVADTPLLAEQAPYDYEPRPGNMIRFLNCRNVAIRGVTICNSPTWTVHIKNSNFVSITDVIIHSEQSNRRVPNDDGIDVNGCDDVHISGCTIHTGDDCIAVFGGQRITVSDCSLTSRSSGLRVGWKGPDIRDATFHNLVIQANRGISVKVRGPGSLENLNFSDILIRTDLVAGHWWGRGEPINVSALPSRPELMPLGTIRGVRFNNIVAKAESGIIVYGSEEGAVRDVRFRDISLTIHAGPLQEACGGNFDLRPSIDLSRALFAHDIPGLYARFVEDLTVDGFELRWADDLPPHFTQALMIEDFDRIRLANLSASAAPSAASGPDLVLNRGRRARLNRVETPDGTTAVVATSDVTALDLAT
jgi:polygalacturonase